MRRQFFVIHRCKLVLNFVLIRRPMHIVLLKNRGTDEYSLLKIAFVHVILFCMVWTRTCASSRNKALSIFPRRRLRTLVLHAPQTNRRFFPSICLLPILSRTHTFLSNVFVCCEISFSTLAQSTQEVNPTTFLHAPGRYGPAQANCLLIIKIESKVYALGVDFHAIETCIP